MRWILWFVFVLLFWASLVSFEKFHIGYSTTGEVKCSLCVKNSQEYKCDCKEVWKPDYSTFEYWFPYIFIFISLIVVWI